jgi:hypothetical protein
VRACCLQRLKLVEVLFDPMFKLFEHAVRLGIALVRVVAFQRL